MALTQPRWDANPNSEARLALIISVFVRRDNFGLSAFRAGRPFCLLLGRRQSRLERRNPGHDRWRTVSKWEWQAYEPAAPLLCACYHCHLIVYSSLMQGRLVSQDNIWRPSAKRLKAEGLSSVALFRFRSTSTARWQYRS